LLEPPRNASWFGYRGITLTVLGVTAVHRLRLGLALTGAALLGLGASACGGDDSPASEPRPPAPIEITASIKDRAVDVSPSDVGAGMANFTISNQSGDSVRLTLSGPTEDSTGEIAPGMTANLKTNLEPGTYEVGAGEDARPRPDRLEVGPERPSSQNELLLP
jgi:hypothetical protein